jgi:hypothetical protein
MVFLQIQNLRNKSFTLPRRSCDDDTNSQIEQQRFQERQPEREIE